VIGVNGVGKTTLLADGDGPHHPAPRRGERSRREPRSRPDLRRARRGLGWVPQEREIFPSLSVRENLTIGARPGHWTLERVFELFPNLAARLSNMGNQLSGGEQQMLSIARALLTNPSSAHGRADRGAGAGIVEALARGAAAPARRGRALDRGWSAEQRVALAFSSRTVVIGQGPHRLRR